MANLESLHRNSGDNRIVWEVTYAYNRIHRVQRGYDDDEYSHTTREQSITHIVAPTFALARAMYDHKYPTFCYYEFVSAVPLCTIDHEMSLTRGQRA